MLALLLAATLALPLGLLASVLMLASMFSLAVTLGQALKGLRRKHYRPAPLLALGATGGHRLVDAEPSTWPEASPGSVAIVGATGM